MHHQQWTSPYSLEIFCFWVQYPHRIFSPFGQWIWNVLFIFCVIGVRSLAHANITWTDPINYQSSYEEFQFYSGAIGASCWLWQNDTGLSCWKQRDCEEAHQMWYECTQPNPTQVMWVCGSFGWPPRHHQGQETKWDSVIEIRLKLSAPRIIHLAQL